MRKQNTTNKKLERKKENWFMESIEIENQYVVFENEQCSMNTDGWLIHKYVEATTKNNRQCEIIEPQV